MSTRFPFDRATPVTAATLTLYVALAIVTGRGNPFEPETEMLDRCGAAIGARIAQGEAWRLVTYAYLHGGLLHLAFNGMALWSFGPQLERLLGSMRFLLLYLVGAICGGVAGNLWHAPQAPLVGGSGALFALFGAAVAMNMRHGKSPLDFLEYEGPRQLIGLIFANLLIGFLLPMVSNAGHLGGLVGGFVLVHQFYGRTGRHAPDRIGRALQGAWAVLLLALLAWCLHPVTRWDHLMTRFLANPPEPAKEELREALDELGLPADLFAEDLAENPKREHLRKLLTPR